MLGQAERAGNNRILGFRRVRDDVHRVLEIAHHGAVVLLRVEQVAHRRFHRLVMGGEGAILAFAGGKEPADAVAFHDERMIAGDGLHALGAIGRLIIGLFVRLEVGRIDAGPLLLLLVPPDVFLALGPGSALRIGRGAVVHDPPIPGPGETPFLLRPDASAVAVAGAVAVVFGEDAGIDPTACGGRAVVLALAEFLEELGLAGFGVGLVGVIAVDLPQNLAGIRVAVDSAKPAIGQAGALVVFIV